MKRLLGLLICGGMSLAVWAEQSTAQSVPPVPPLPSTAPELALHAAKGFTTAVAVEGYTFLFMPTAGAFVSIPIPIARTDIELTPGIGIAYLFNPIGNVPTTYWVPVGLSFDVRSRGVALSGRYYVPISEPLESGIVAATVRGYIPVWTGARDEIDLAVDFGLSVTWSVVGSPSYYLTLGPTLAYRHTW